MYQPDAHVNNLDMKAIINSFMIDCWHMWDALKHDPALPNVADAELTAHWAKHKCVEILNAFANSYKHVVRIKPSDLQAQITGFTSGPVSATSEISYWRADNPQDIKTIDALDLAEQSYAAWEDFLAVNGIAKPDIPVQFLKP